MLRQVLNYYSHDVQTLIIRSSIFFMIPVNFDAFPGIARLYL